MSVYHFPLFVHWGSLSMRMDCWEVSYLHDVTLFLIIIWLHSLSECDCQTSGRLCSVDTVLPDVVPASFGQTEEHMKTPENSDLLLLLPSSPQVLTADPTQTWAFILLQLSVEDYTKP